MNVKGAIIEQSDFQITKITSIGHPCANLLNMTHLRKSYVAQCATLRSIPDKVSTSI